MANFLDVNSNQKIFILAFRPIERIVSGYLAQTTRHCRANGFIICPPGTGVIGMQARKTLAHPWLQRYLYITMRRNRSDNETRINRESAPVQCLAHRRPRLMSLSFPAAPVLLPEARAVPASTNARWPPRLRAAKPPDPVSD
jgi:hypothetical protein